MSLLGRERWLGERVRIITGFYKGRVGIVNECSMISPHILVVRDPDGHPMIVREEMCQLTDPKDNKPLPLPG